jgi:hypothetical protein
MTKNIISKIKTLASINALGNQVSAEDILLRRSTVEFLASQKAIELGENGNFAFTSPEYQEIYLEAFEVKKLENVYLLVKWPESQVIMDEEWFDKECHLADSERDSDIGNSAYFVPMRRVRILESKLRVIHEG